MAETDERNRPPVLPGRDGTKPKKHSMTRLMPSLLATILLALGLQVAPVQAQVFGSRTFVSAATGDDNNDCRTPVPTHVLIIFSGPCRTLQVAHDRTNDQGEITVLDPGGYGAVTITKSISIVNDGIGEASILVSGGAAGITVDAGMGGYVNLCGITVQGIGGGAGGTGLVFNSGFSLTITNCVFRNHTGNGINFQPSLGSHLAVSNTLVADNALNGILIQPTGAGSATAVIERVGLYNNSFAGLNVIGNSTTGAVDVSVTDSAAGNNGTGGGFVVQSTGARASLMVVHSVAASNAIGIQALGSGAVLLLGDSTLSANGTVVSASGGGQAFSFGDNYIFDANPGLRRLIFSPISKE